MLFIKTNQEELCNNFIELAKTDEELREAMNTVIEKDIYEETFEKHLFVIKEKSNFFYSKIEFGFDVDGFIKTARG